MALKRIVWWLLRITLLMHMNAYVERLVHGYGEVNIFDKFGSGVS